VGAEEGGKAYYSRALDRLCAWTETIPLPLLKRTEQFQGLARGVPKAVLAHRSEEALVFIERIAREDSVDLLHIEHLWLAEYAARAAGLIPVRAACLQEVTSRILFESLRIMPLNPLAGARFLQMLVYRRWERLASAHFECLFASTQQDAVYLGKLVPGLDVGLHPMSVDCEYMKPVVHLEDPKTVVFSGSPAHPGAMRGLRWFLRAVWPGVLRRRPGMRLMVIGFTETPPLAAVSRNRRVSFLGRVFDPRSVLGRGAVFVSSPRPCSGMNVEVLDAMAMEKAVVSTTRGIEGIEAVDGREVFVADSAEDFVRRIGELIVSKSLRREIGIGARRMVETKYSNRVVLAGMERGYLEAAEERRQ